MENTRIQHIMKYMPLKTPAVSHDHSSQRRARSRWAHLVAHAPLPWLNHSRSDNHMKKTQRKETIGNKHFESSVELWNMTLVPKKTCRPIHFKHLIALDWITELAAITHSDPFCAHQVALDTTHIGTHCATTTAGRIRTFAWDWARKAPMCWWYQMTMAFYKSNKTDG